MSQSGFETVNNLSGIWKTAVQAIMFLVLWAAVFDVKKGKRDGIAAILFVLLNIGSEFLPCASWVKYVLSGLIVLGYGWINYKKQIVKAVFAMLAFYNLHSLSFLIANSIYMEVTNIMMKSLDVLQEN
ncbi:MAG: ATP-binding protein, partial [Ruminococcus flavefaciens]|nr:ATP-binding protein [Ruminococcus flavefaciens]